MRQTQYDYLYVVGAACPETGRTAGLLAPTINAGVINRFFAQLVPEIDADAHVVMFWDQAGFHTAHAVAPPENVTLIPLPPYSPELNPIENLWHYLRSHHWSNRRYEDYDELRAAACEAWQVVCLDPEIIQTVCRVDYLKTGEVKA